MRARTLSGIEIGRRFLRFFHERGHTVVPSSSLVPAGDPTLLFTNAGMVQFKEVFLGLERRSYVRAATLQRCMRVSGKHNDLEEVGPSPKHHTLFFMLGNFSFGDYFKREAVPYAWEFVTNDLGIEPDRLVATVLHDDDESYAHWQTIGLPASRIFRMGEETNFWAMGPTGPCGPNSELYYDWGPEACTCQRPDCSVALDNGCARWLEIWNLVFMQFNQAADGTRTPLPKPGVDTGMGLERIASVVQGVPSVYDTDLFTPIIARIQTLVGHDSGERASAYVPYRVIADHGRAAAFLIADGVTPGNDGRAYVLRMILRRAIRFARRAGFDGPFLAQVADAVVDHMGADHQQLVERRAFIHQVVAAEETRFSHTLTTGLERLDEVLEEAGRRRERLLPGAAVFRLYDTYGLPIEVVRDVAREHGFEVDDGGFHREMEAQRERSRVTHEQIPVDGSGATAGTEPLRPTEFVGYTDKASRATIVDILVGGSGAADAGEDADVVVLLDRTPFYAEAGGQVGDRGRLVAADAAAVVEITDTRRIAPNVTGHIGRVTNGRIRRGMQVNAVIDVDHRAAVARNHTATHLLHRVLQDVLGGHARQAGSLVAADRLRFDFTHLAPLTPEQRDDVERRVNAVILEGRAVETRIMPLDEALREGTMALFGEKYGEEVRVVTVRDFSRELCGGTHVATTGEIGAFFITAEGSAASGVRRIEAVTGWGAYDRAKTQERSLLDIAARVRGPVPEVADRVRRLVETVRTLEDGARRGQAAPASWSAKTTNVGDVRVATVHAPVGWDHAQLRKIGDQLREQHGQGVFVLGSASDAAADSPSHAGVNLVTMVTPEPQSRGLSAGAIVQKVASELDGRGGGRADVAQGTGKDAARLDQALERVPEIVKSLMKGA